MTTSVRSLCRLFSVILSTELIPSNAIDNQCGTVFLRTEKVVENGTVKIEYRPSSFLMKNNYSFERKWLRFGGGDMKALKLDSGSYEEKMEQNNKYVLTIFRFNVSMNGQYRVYCGSFLRNPYTDPVTVNLPEPPSVPVIVGLQDIENCTDCIVGEDNEMFELACEIYGGSRPLNVTMTIGNESYKPLEWNLTTYMVLFTVRDHHHMENVIFSVMNDALSSPLNVRAQMFVITNPDSRETGDYIRTTANPDGRETGNNMSTTGTNETCVGLEALIGSVISVLAVGILIGVICTLFILTIKRIKTGSKTQPTVSHEIQLTGPPTAVDTYEQLQNRTDTEIRGTYDFLEVNSSVQQSSQSQYESLNDEAEKYHTYTDLKQSR